MKLITVVFTSIGSFIALFLLTKLIGNKQMSQLNMFDYINGITIGSIAAEMATALEGDMLYPLIAMALYTAASLLINFLATKSIRLRRFLNGSSLVLYQGGELYRENLKKARLDLNEFLTQCRISGYFDLQDLEMAILEHNGHISFLPTSEARPATPEDLNRHPQKAAPMYNLVLDGKVLEGNLKAIGKDIEWLGSELKSKGYPELRKVFLACCDEAGTMEVYERTREKPDRDPFQ